MDNKLKAVIIALIAGAVIAAVYFYSTKPKSGAVNTVEKASDKVPEIQTNAAQKVPEINPLDRANPFKYNNPLR